jgi:hypothetical protein
MFSWPIGLAILEVLWPGPANIAEERMRYVDGENAFGGTADGDNRGIPLTGVSSTANDGVNGNVQGGVASNTNDEREGTASANRRIKTKKDELDIFVLHGVVGFAGMVLTGIFARY